MALSTIKCAKGVFTFVANYWRVLIVPRSDYSRCLSCVKEHSPATFCKSSPNSLLLSTHGANGKDILPKKQSSDGPKTKNIESKITLLGTDDSVTITTVPEATKISRRRDLKLVKMIDFDTKTQRPVYKLMTGAQFFEEDKKQRQLKVIKRQNELIKGEKLLSLSYRISQHDLQSRINNVVKWLAKNYEVRVVINGDSDSIASSERVFKVIESAINENGRIVQKREKGNDLRFQILPPKRDAKETKDIKTEDTDVL